MKKQIIPVLLGADLNAYSVARAFHEAFGVKSFAFGKYKLGATSMSSIVKFTVVKNLSDDKKTVEMLLNFAKKQRNAELYLFGCTDEYAEMIIRNREALAEYYFCHCIGERLAELLQSKDSFYNICDKFGIPHPKTVIFSSFSDYSLLFGDIGFNYPIIIKPSRSSLYWKNPFPNMKKVYSAKTPSEAKKILVDIYSSGYDSTVILQDTIPGDDSRMYVLTCYSGSDGKVKRACLGHVLLEEHTPKGLGNHVAVITEQHPEITDVLCNFLDDIGYVGFSNFDIKFDERDNKFKVFEINLRQGRSNYYVTAAGQNVAESVVFDRKGALPDEREICEKKIFWHTVPKKIVYKYIKGTKAEKDVLSMENTPAESSTLFYKPDMKNPLRSFYIYAHNIKYFSKYKKYPQR